MANIPFRIIPGMNLNTTEYDAKQRWVDGNWVRFWRGEVRPLGGWVSANTPTGPVVMDGVARVMLSWRDQSEQKHLAIGTNSNLYEYDGSNLRDISPTTDPVPPGLVSGGTGSGYGGFTYGTENYGEPRSFASLTIAPGSWTMDNWGQEMVACANWYGAIYKWAPGDIEATALEDVATGTEVPQKNRAIFVTQERHLVAVGAGMYVTDHWERDQRKVAWSTQENYLEWTPSIINSAGSLPLQTSGLAICGTRFKTESLIWTDVDVHRMSYLGPPYFYGITKLAVNAGIVGPNAYAITNRFVIWVSKDSIMMYDGTVKELSSDISEWYRNLVNPYQAGKIAVGHNPRFNEIWILFPSTAGWENDLYAIWNYEENTWTKGELARVVWDDAEIFDYPMAVKPINVGPGLDDPTSELYQHEYGWRNGTESRVGEVWIKSAPMEFGAGDNLMVARKLIQDTWTMGGQGSQFLQVQFVTKLAPEDRNSIVEGPYTLDYERGYTDIRFTGRQVQFIFSAVSDSNWSIGDWRIEAVPGSGR